MKPSDLSRAIVHYRGTVQGVGFRATAKAQSAGLAVCGWVRNESDGSVWLEAEGTISDVERFLHRVRTVLSNRIEMEKVDWVAPLATETSFSIRY